MSRTWILGKGSSSREWLGAETGSPGTGHGPNPARAQGALGQQLQTHGGVSCAAPGVGVNPWESLPTQDVL